MGGASGSPPIQEGASGSPPVSGGGEGASGSPPSPERAAKQGARPLVRFREFPNFGDAGKRFPRSPRAPGAQGARGARPRSWGASPRGTLDFFLQNQII